MEKAALTLGPRLEKESGPGQDCLAAAMSAYPQTFWSVWLVLERLRAPTDNNSSQLKQRQESKLTPTVHPNHQVVGGT